MKRFKFSLQKLLETRLALEEAAQRRLADGLRCLQSAQTELACAQECLRAESRRLESFNGRQTDKHELMRLARYRQAALQLVRHNAQMVHKQEVLVSDLRKQLRVIMVERKSMEQLRDIELKQWHLEQRRMEQKNNDEISSQRYLRRVVAEIGMI